MAKESLLGYENAVAQNVTLGESEAVDADGTQSLPGIGVICRDAVEPPAQVGEGLLEDDIEAVLFGVEVVIQGGRPDPDVFGDVGPLRALIPVASEPVDRRVENLGPPGAFVPGPASGS